MFLEKVTPYILFIAQQFDVVQVTHNTFRIVRATA